MECRAFGSFHAADPLTNHENAKGHASSAVTVEQLARPKTLRFQILDEDGFVCKARAVLTFNGRLIASEYGGLTRFLFASPDNYVKSRPSAWRMDVCRFS